MGDDGFKNLLISVLLKIVFVVISLMVACFDIASISSQVPSFPMPHRYPISIRNYEIPKVRISTSTGIRS